eukprot:5102454-Alexandrium_andersonii.AAC.1
MAAAQHACSARLATASRGQRRPGLRRDGFPGAARGALLGEWGSRRSSSVAQRLMLMRLVRCPVLERALPRA